MYVDGINLRRIGRHLGLHHSSVSLWVKAYAANLPDAPKPEEVKAAEMDELLTFIGDIKTGSTSSPSLIGKHAASSAGKWPGNVHSRLFRMWLMQHPKPNAITVMLSFLLEEHKRLKRLQREFAERGTDLHTDRTP